MERVEVDTMRQWFQQVVDTVADLSTQAAQVQGLREQVDSLAQRVRELEQNNYSLQQSLYDANGRIAQLEHEVNTHQAAATAANEQVNALKETIVQADYRVADLNTQVSNERDSHRITQSNLEDSRRATQEWEQRYNSTSEALTMATGERDEWRNRATDWERRASELQSKLDRLQSILNPPHAVSGDFQAVG